MSGRVQHVSGALRTLMEGLVDYAGLFPPAGLGMEDAVTHYDRYRAGEHAWMLGRFVVPVSRLEEMARCQPEGGQGWRFSALAGGDVAADLDRVRAFNEGRAAIDSIEAKATTPEGVARLEPLVLAGLETFVEIPLGGDAAPMLDAVKAVGARAKVRTGGLTADAFPEPAALARFIGGCARAGVPFKATAGLHHPVRSVRRFTYEPESPSGWTHGFLNVFLAAALARQGTGEERLAAILAETRPEAFRFDDEGAAWQGERVTTEELAATRRDLALSFGSCSFAEPVADLREMGLL